jgi:hypothetical protein
MYKLITHISLNLEIFYYTVMQEHRQLIKRASAEEKDSWAAPPQILKTP